MLVMSAPIRKSAALVNLETEKLLLVQDKEASDQLVTALGRLLDRL